MRTERSLMSGLDAPISVTDENECSGGTATMAGN